MAHNEENLANPPLLDGAPDRAPIEGAFFDCIPRALGAWDTVHVPPSTDCVS